MRPITFFRSADDPEMSSVGLSAVVTVPQLWVPSPYGPFMDLMDDPAESPPAQTVLWFCKSLQRRNLATAEENLCRQSPLEGSAVKGIAGLKSVEP